jgi:hypothetical protein
LFGTPEKSYHFKKIQKILASSIDMGNISGTDGASARYNCSQARSPFGHTVWTAK